MRNLNFNNEPASYGPTQIQKTDTGVLREVEERHGEIEQLQSDIVNLHQIHRDFADIVQDHGQIIDNIELSVTETETHVIKSAVDLGNAARLQTSARRKKILCWAILLIVIVLAVIITLAVVLPKK